MCGISCIFFVLPAKVTSLFQFRRLELVSMRVLDERHGSITCVLGILTASSSEFLI